MNRNHFSFWITLVLCFHSILVQSSSWRNICTNSCSTPILGEDFIETRAAELSKACYDVDLDHFKTLLDMDPKTLKKVLNHKPSNNTHVTPFFIFCISAARIFDHAEFSGNTLRTSYLEVLGLLLKGGADPNSSLFDGTTPLILAFRYEQFEWIDLLLSHGADPNCVDFLGLNPLLFACEQGDSELISKLLGAGANPNFVYKFKYDPRFLFDAMFKFSPIDHEYIQNIVKDYDLDAQYNLIKLVPETERLQIVYEIGFNDIIRSQYRSIGVKLERCKYLKEYQKENGIDGDKSLLFCSVLDGNISMLKCFLMKRQLSSFVKVTYYDFVLFFEFGRPRLDISLLEAASVTDDLGIVEFLINQGAKVTQAALVWTAKRGNLFLIKLFVKEFKKLEIYFKNKNIFDGAIVSGNQELIDYLMETYNYKFYEESCEIAAQFGHLEIIKDCHTNHGISIIGSEKGNPDYPCTWTYRLKNDAIFGKCLS